MENSEMKKKLEKKEQKMLEQEILLSKYKQKENEFELKKDEMEININFYLNKKTELEKSLEKSEKEKSSLQQNIIELTNQNVQLKKELKNMQNNHIKYEEKNVKIEENFFSEIDNSETNKSPVSLRLVCHFNGNSVTVGGSFNSWVEEKLTEKNEENFWVFDVSLVPGIKHFFRFFVESDLRLDFNYEVDLDENKNLSNFIIAK